MIRIKMMIVDRIEIMAVHGHCIAQKWACFLLTKAIARWIGNKVNLKPNV